MPRGEQVIDALHTLFSQLVREPRGFTLGESARGHRTINILAIVDRLREHAAQACLHQCCGVAADVPGVLHNCGGPGPYGLQRSDCHHQRVLLPLEETGGLDGQARGVWESEVFVETAREDSCHMGVTVDESREQGLSPPVVDLGVGIRPEDRVGGADRHDRVAFDRERHVVLNGIDGHDGCMREDDGPAGRRLSLEAALLEKECCGAGAGSGEQFPPADVDRIAGELRRRRRAMDRRC